MGWSSVKRDSNNRAGIQTFDFSCSPFPSHYTRNHRSIPATGFMMKRLFQLFLVFEKTLIFSSYKPHTKRRYSMLRTFTVVLVLIAFFCGIGFSQIPQTLSYQGVLKDASGVIVPNANYNLTFRIYSGAIGGTALWTEAQSVAVTVGIFNVILGGSTTLT